MDLHDTKVTTKMEIILPILKNEYYLWIDNKESQRPQVIQDRLSIALDKKGILVNHLTVSPKFELFFSFWVSDFDSGSFSLGLKETMGGGLIVSTTRVNDYG